MTEEINFLNGETSKIRNLDKKQKRITDFNEEVSMELAYLDISHLSTNDNLNEFDDKYKDEERENLMNSIIKFGVLEPILVYPNNDSHFTEEKTYTIIDGKERVKILSKMGENNVLALIDYTMTPQTASIARIILKEKIRLNIDEKYFLYNQLRNITESISTKEIEKMLNEKNDSFRFYEQLLDLEKRYENVPKLYKALVKLKEQMFEGKITLEDCLKKANKKVDNYHKKQEKEEIKEEIDEKAEQAKEMNQIDKGEDAIEQSRGNELDELTEIGNQNYQQSVNNRRILPTSLTKQLVARDESMCIICGYGGKHNLSVAPGLEKHHIVDVQYGGSDNLNNLITLCPNCHSLVTNFLNGKSNEYSPTPEDLKNNPQNWGSVVLGNMGRISKEKALEEIKNKDEKTYKLVKNKKMTVGQAVEKLKIQNTMPEEFENNPYQTFKNKLFSLVDKGFKLHSQTLENEYKEFLKTNKTNIDNKFIEIDEQKNNLQKDVDFEKSENIEEENLVRESSELEDKLNKKLEEKMNKKSKNIIDLNNDEFNQHLEEIKNLNLNEDEKDSKNENDEISFIEK